MSRIQDLAIRVAEQIGRSGLRRQWRGVLVHEKNVVGAQRGRGLFILLCKKNRVRKFRYLCSSGSPIDCHIEFFYIVHLLKRSDLICLCEILVLLTTKYLLKSRYRAISDFSFDPLDSVVDCLQMR